MTLPLGDSASLKMLFSPEFARRCGRRDFRFNDLLYCRLIPAHAVRPRGARLTPPRPPFSTPYASLSAYAYFRRRHATLLFSARFLSPTLTAPFHALFRRHDDGSRAAGPAFTPPASRQVGFGSHTGRSCT